MGLLDWLTDGIGSSMGQDATGTGAMLPQTMPEPPMPSVQQTGADMPPPLPTGQSPLSFQWPEFAQPPMPPGMNPMTSDIGAGMQGGGLPPPLPAAPSVPMPAPRPAEAPPRLAMNDTLTRSSAPGAPLPLSPAQAGNAYSSYKAAGGGGPVQIFGAEPGGAPGGGSFIGRALGLDANKERSMFGSLGAGLTAAGNSKGKSKGQAAFGGAGAALEGGQKAEDKAYDQRLKALGLDVKAKGQEDYTALGRDRLELSKQELKQNLDKMTGAGMTDAQKYLEAQRRAAADVDSRGLLIRLKDGTLTPEQFKAESKAIKDGHMKGLGLDPSKAAPGDFTNPHRLMPGASRSDFDRDVQPGQAYINPKDGQVYVRKGGSPTATAEAAPATPTPEVAATGGTDAEDTYNGV